MTTKIYHLILFGSSKILFCDYTMNNDMVVIIPSEILQGYVGEKTKRMTKKILKEEFNMSDTLWYTILRTGLITFTRLKSMMKNEKFKQYLQDKGMLIDITEMF